MSTTLRSSSEPNSCRTKLLVQRRFITLFILVKVPFKHTRGVSQLARFKDESVTQLYYQKFVKSFVEEEEEEMENPLLGGSEEISRSDSSSSSNERRERQREYQRRSDAIAYGNRYQKAAALVDLAEDGIGLPEQVLNDTRFERAAKFYFFYIRFDILWSLNLFVLIALNFFERPLWCARYTAHSCNDRDYFFLGQLPYLTKAQSLVYEGITLIILIIHTLFPIAYEGWTIYWKSLLNKLKVIFLFVLVADMLIYALYLSPVAISSLPLRIAPYIRIVFFVLNIRELRACAVTLSGMMGMYLNVLALGLLFTLFCSWLAYIIFEDTQQGKILFYSYGSTLYQMFVLFTTSNNPDVWIPAYKESRWNSLFFVIYVLLGVYFITNLILAVVYDSFKDQLAKQVVEMDSTRRSILEKAFNLIDTHKKGFLDKDQCIRLFEELNKYRTQISTQTEILNYDQLYLLKVNFLVWTLKLRYINLDEFNDLCNAIALRFQKEASPSLFEKCPSFYHAPLTEKLKDFVRGPVFGYIIAAILMLNLVTVIIESTLDIEDNSGQKVWQDVEFVFGKDLISYPEIMISCGISLSKRVIGPTLVGGGLDDEVTWVEVALAVAERDERSKSSALRAYLMAADNIINIFES
ncbi:hypothetical protein IFM89_025737 [Coptis chinensis]|uniref:EF-hand domain-containing protein n=1 Tax=Coptis chinensis TaxID=261450 RepID=A0A835LZN7_9MAGN|nr:hypothetical protein IFM89_025737 [Coptis chinensis]